MEAVFGSEPSAMTCIWALLNRSKSLLKFSGKNFSWAKNDHNCPFWAICVFLKQKLSNYPLTIVGNGKQKRDFLYISDVCEAFYKAAISKYKNEIFNLGRGKAETINYLSSLISNKKKYIKWRPGEPFKTEANINKIKKYLKWKPKIDLRFGINEVLKNIDYWKNAPLWTQKKIKLATKNWMKYLR